MSDKVLLRPVAGYRYKICDHISFGGEPAQETKSVFSRSRRFTIGLDCKVCQTMYSVEVISFFDSESKHKERKDRTDAQGEDKPRKYEYGQKPTIEHERRDT